jgi:hypothetical protein
MHIGERETVINGGIHQNRERALKDTRCSRFEIIIPDLK